MEWVETTGKTVEDAKEAALDQLGVHEDDAEFEVLEAPRVGLFGRLRGEARVRARVRPTRPRPKAERRDRKRRRPEGSRQGASSEATAASDRSAGASPGEGRTSTRRRSRGGRAGGQKANRTGGAARTAREANVVNGDGEEGSGMV